MKSVPPSQREAIASIPAASATGCVNETMGQTLKLQILTPGYPGGLGGFGEFQLRINPFVSLFAASLIAILPTHAWAQSAPADEPVVRREAVSVQDRDRPEYSSDGRRLGAFVLNASLDLSVASTDNLFAAEPFDVCDPPPIGESCPGELDDIIYGVAPSARLESDWSRNMVALEAGAEFLSHQDFSNEDTDSHYFRALGRLDIGENTALRGSARTAHEVSPRTDPDSPDEGAPVEYDRTDFSAGIEHRFARATVSVDAGEDEYDYEGDQNDRDNTQDFIRGRLAYEVSPRLALVLRAEHDERDYTDPTAVNADSENNTYMAGVNINTNIMRGELTVGQYERDYEDPAVATLDGLAVSGRLEWYVTELTTLTFGARQDADDEVSVQSRLPYEVSEYSARVDHELRRNVLLMASARVGTRDYQVNLTPPREDEYTEAEIGADWLVNRNAAVRFRYERDEVESSGEPASRDYEVNKVTVGLTVRL